MDKRIFHIATIPQREAALKEVLDSVINQADEIHVYMNEWSHTPNYLNNSKIKIYRSQQENGNLGDVGKFYNCENWERGYHFTIDDKIVYPKNHAELQIKTIERHNREVVVSCHGRLMKPKTTSYYNDCEAFYGVLMQQCKDKFAHELGTGAMTFHTDTVPFFELDIFPYINMTDIYFSMFLQQNEIPILIRAHDAGDFTIAKQHDDRYSIHNYLNKNDEFQTQVVNTIDWKLNTSESPNQNNQ
jgi:hypothetical protein